MRHTRVKDTPRSRETQSLISLSESIRRWQVSGESLESRIGDCILAFSYGFLDNVTIRETSLGTGPGNNSCSVHWLKDFCVRSNLTVQLAWQDRLEQTTQHTPCVSLWLQHSLT